jgi:predicted component of type VI protein secretion system
MKKFLVMFCFVLFSFCFIGCTSNPDVINVDGQVDEVEMSVIRLAVGATLTLYPDAVPIAYTVSKQLVALYDDEMVPLGEYDVLISEKINALDLTDVEKASAIELYGFIKTSTIAKLESLSIKAPETKVVVIEAIARAVYEASAARLGLDE